MLMTYYIIMGCIAIVEALALLVFIWKWWDRGEKLGIEAIRLKIEKDQVEELKVEKYEFEAQLEMRDKDISILRIEIDASVEQLTKEQSSHRLQEDQIERIREIIQGDTVGTEDSESE